MAREHVYALGLGSNAGDRAQNIAVALQRLEQLHGVRVLRVSSLYATAPEGPAQAEFLNAVAVVGSELEPHEMLAACKLSERQLGRGKSQRWGPRTIDIDLLLYDGPDLASEELQLPHPRLCERDFVLVPLAEIMPNLVLPDGRTALEAAGGRGVRVAALERRGGGWCVR